MQPIEGAITTVLGMIGFITAISAGTNHTCALSESGKARCWGLNDRGQAPPEGGGGAAVEALQKAKQTKSKIVTIVMVKAVFLFVELSKKSFVNIIGSGCSGENWKS